MRRGRLSCFLTGKRVGARIEVVKALNEASVRDALRDVVDPEVGINIIDLGLVYGVEIEGSRALVRMTLTSAGCPMGEILIEDVERRLADAFPSESAHEVCIVWEPPWSPEQMSPAARQALGWKT